MRILVAVLVMLLSGLNIGHAESYRATLAGKVVNIPFPDGTKKEKDDPSKHSSSYRFLVVDRASEQPKLDIGLHLDSYAPAEKNADQAKRTFRATIEQLGLNIPMDTLQVLTLDDMNPAFKVYWAPYYHLGTGNPEKPYMIYKSTILTDKTGSVGTVIGMAGILVFKEAGPSDLKTAESFMDQMLAAIIKDASLR